MNIEEILMAIGARGRIGLASLFSVEKEDIVMRFWDAGISYFITKTMMDFNNREGERPVFGRQWVDHGETLFHLGSTCNESPDFYYKHELIEHKLNALIKKGVAVIPSIGSKNIDAGAWEGMQRYLSGQRTPIIELNFRYTYRSLVQHYKKEIVGDTSVNCDEYGNDYSNGIPNLSEFEKMRIRTRANHDFKIILGAIREIFPPDQYCLIAKLWPSRDLKAHLSYVAENYFDSVTLVNSIKAEPPKYFENFPREKIPQKSGLGLRGDRDDALRIAMAMNYPLPIFVSGGVAVEARSMTEGSLREGIKDITSCFGLGADYVQLGIVAYGCGPRTVAAIMKALGPVYGLGTRQKLIKAA